MRNLALLTVASEVGGQGVLSAITTVGFPIVMCLIFCLYIRSINEAHKQETKGFIESINKNTLVLQKLCDRLDAEGVMHDDKEQ